VRTKFVPAAIEESIKTVIVEIADPPTVEICTGFGEKITVTPRSTEWLRSVTLPVKLPRPVTVRLSAAIAPAGMESDADDAATWMSLAVNETVTGKSGAVEVVWVVSPL